MEGNRTLVFKIKLLTTMLSMCLFYPILANPGEVKLVISGFETNEGLVIIKVYKGPEGFAKEDDLAYKIYKENIQDLECRLAIDLPAGEYAILVIHDENGNELLDTNFIGMPKEPVGVSINPKKSKPDYEKSKFTVTVSSSLTIDIIVDTIF
jgi:uncharacterized protein (DUF2141 family)